MRADADYVEDNLVNGHLHPFGTRKCGVKRMKRMKRIKWIKCHCEAVLFRRSSLLSGDCFASLATAVAV